MENILDAANQLDYHPIWLNAASVYTQDLAAWNTGGNGDNLYFGNSFVPLDHTPEGSANAAYTSIVKAHGGDMAYPGRFSTSSFLLWRLAAKACGDDLARDCVMTKLKATRALGCRRPRRRQDPCEPDHIFTQFMKLDGTTSCSRSRARRAKLACRRHLGDRVEPRSTPSPSSRGYGEDRLAHNVTGWSLLRPAGGLPRHLLGSARPAATGRVVSDTGPFAPPQSPLPSERGR